MTDLIDYAKRQGIGLVPTINSPNNAWMRSQMLHGAEIEKLILTTLARSARTVDFK